MTERAAIVAGASSGIGLAVARMLCEEGHAVTLVAHRPEKLEAADGRLDVLVNNARVGIGAPIGELDTKRALLSLAPGCVIPEIVFRRPAEGSPDCGL